MERSTQIGPLWWVDEILDRDGHHPATFSYKHQNCFVNLGKLDLKSSVAAIALALPTLQIKPQRNTYGVVLLRCNYLNYSNKILNKFLSLLIYSNRRETICSNTIRTSNVIVEFPR